MQNKKDIQVMLKEAGILFAITLLAGLMLGFVYELTKEPIRIQEENAVREACAAVFEGAAEFSPIDYVPGDALAAELKENGVKIGTVYEARGADGTLLGHVVQSVTTEGYGGNIVLYVGVTLEGKLNDISILEISETPGLGMEAEKVLVPQFHDKTVPGFSYTKTGSKNDSEIDAISGATITTSAVTGAVNGGLKAAAELAQGGGRNE